MRFSNTGKEREFLTPLADIGGLRWPPNGRALVIWGTDDEGKKGIFEFDDATGAIAPIVATGEDFREPVWSPNGRSLYYHLSRVTARERETGGERESFRDHWRSITWLSRPYGGDQDRHSHIL